MRQPRVAKLWFAVALLLAACGGGTSAFDRAAKVLGDDSRFASAVGARDALAEAADLVQSDAAACAKKSSPLDSRCVVRSQLAAFYETESAEMTACDASQRSAVREAARLALRRVDNHTLPPIVRCSAAGG